MTSPLGVPNAPVGHTGVPMGATELATPGVSPTTFGASPLIGATCAGASPAPASDAMASAMTGAGAGSPTTGADAARGGSITDWPGPRFLVGGGRRAIALGTSAAAGPASRPLAY